MQKINNEIGVKWFGMQMAFLSRFTDFFWVHYAYQNIKKSICKLRSSQQINLGAGFLRIFTVTFDRLF